MPIYDNYPSFPGKVEIYNFNIIVTYKPMMALTHCRCISLQNVINVDMLAHRVSEQYMKDLSENSCPRCENFTQAAFLFEKVQICYKFFYILTPIVEVIVVWKKCVLVCGIWRYL